MNTNLSFYLIAVLLLLKSFEAIRRSDPNYSEEFKQVYDAKLNATIIICCNMGLNQQSEDKLILTIRPMMLSFQKLNFFNIDILVCDNIHKKIHGKIDFKMVSIGNESQISAITSDVLIVFGSPGKERRDFHSYGQNNALEMFKGRLSINCELYVSRHQFYHSGPALLYDTVLLSTQSEAHRYTHSWLATLDIKQQIHAPPAVVISRVFALPAYAKTVYSTIRNNSVSSFMPNILSLSFDPQEEMTFIRKAVHRLNKKQVSDRGHRIQHLNILWSAECIEYKNTSDLDLNKIQLNKEMQQIRIRKVLLALDAAVISSNNQLPSKIIIKFLPYRSSNSGCSVNYTSSSSSVEEILKSSSALWLRLPPLTVLSKDAPPAISSSKKMISQTNINTSTSFDYDDEWRSLIAIEDLIVETQMLGCIFFLVTNSYSMALSRKAKDAHSNVYDWLVNGVGSFAVKDIDSLVTGISSQVLSLAPEGQQKLCNTAKNFAEEQYSQKRAAETLKRMILDGIIGSTFRRFVSKPETMVTVRNLSLSVSSATAAVSSPQKEKFLSSSIVKHSRSIDYSRNASIYKYAAVIIEPRLDPTFEFCVRNVMYHLSSEWQLIVIHSSGPLGNERYVKQSLRNLPGVQVTFIATNLVTDGESYNKLVKSPAFWKNFKVRGLSKILLFQTDSVMLRRGVDDFMGWDYIGAPWHMEKEESNLWLRRFQRNGVLSQVI